MTHAPVATAPRELRPYQVDAADAVERKWSKGTRRTGVVLPTGSGKSTVIGELIRRGYRNGEPVVALAHRGELLDQMRRDLLAVDPTIPHDDIGIVRAEQDDADRPIVFAWPPHTAARRWGRAPASSGTRYTTPVPRDFTPRSASWAATTTR